MRACLLLRSGCTSGAGQRATAVLWLRAQVGDLKLSMAAEFEKVSHEAHAAAQARARYARSACTLMRAHLVWGQRYP